MDAALHVIACATTLLLFCGTPCGRMRQQVTMERCHTEVSGGERCRRWCGVNHDVMLLALEYAQALCEQQEVRDARDNVFIPRSRWRW